MPADICMHPWDYRADPFRIAGNLYYVGNRDVSSHLIDTGDGLILIDTTYPQTVYLLLESIRRLGFDPADIRYLLNCHAHYDHCGGTRPLAGLTGARTALGKDDAFILTERPELSCAPEYGVSFYESFQVDQPLADGDTIRLGDTVIECIHTPGHTPGTMSYFFTIHEAGRGLSVGIHGGPGLNTLTDEYLGTYSRPESARRDYLASIDKLKQRHVDLFIGAHPGQNNAFGKQRRMNEKENPFIDPAEWTRFLDGLETNAKKAFATSDTLARLRR